MKLSKRVLVSLMVLSVLSNSVMGEASSPSSKAKLIVDRTGVSGGFVVHLGCGDGRLTCSLLQNDRYLVQGLDKSLENVRSAREFAREGGLYGKVSIKTLDTLKMPYANDMVNLIVVTNQSGVSESELKRVLAPGGVLCFDRPSDSGEPLGIWIKPWPENIDDWSHFLHDSTNNAVAEDEKIGPPRRLRWKAEPLHCRSHELPSSVQAVVSCGGRIFTIIDEAPSGIYLNRQQGKLPWHCKLVARDAFNGKLLWKMPMKDWQSRFGAGVLQRYGIHQTIPRRLVASGKQVFVTPAFRNSPVSVLDAGTGEVVMEFLPDTMDADELILSDGVLVVKTMAEPKNIQYSSLITGSGLPECGIVALETSSGKKLWKKSGIKILPYSLSAASGKVVFNNMSHIVCLDLKTGGEVWKAPEPKEKVVGAGVTVVIKDDVVLSHSHQGRKWARKKLGPPELIAYSMEDGKKLWESPGDVGMAAGCTMQTDLFALGNLVWLGNSENLLELESGRKAVELDFGETLSPGHHFRCHRSKATKNYLITPKRGIEFIDLADSDGHVRNDWLRGPCMTGVTPANGLLYVPPNQCMCYPGVLLSGYLSASPEEPPEFTPSGKSDLRGGPAYGVIDSKDLRAEAGDWPMYRRDAARSGFNDIQVGARLNKLWSVKLQEKCSQPIVVDDRLYTAEKDAHRIVCLDAENGNLVWSFTGGGRIDSSPTFDNGRIFFGCADGHVYCLDASNGTLVWEFRAAPNGEQIISFEQPESIWPVSGSVLVKNNTVYFAAGRSSYLDGGIMLYALDAKTGQVKHHHHLDGPHPDSVNETGAPFSMEGALPDLLVSVGDEIFMGRCKFDLSLNRMPVVHESQVYLEKLEGSGKSIKKLSDQGELDMGTSHLAPTNGFLDDSGFDRLYWMHSKRWPGFYFARHAPKSGQLLVFDNENTYAVKYFYEFNTHSPSVVTGDKGYLLYSDKLDNQPELEELDKDIRAIDWLPSKEKTGNPEKGRAFNKGTGYVRSKPPIWQKMVPMTHLLQ